jgi:hypothetical protein
MPVPAPVMRTRGVFRVVFVIVIKKAEVAREF